jgi:hypothetical protein
MLGSAAMATTETSSADTLETPATWRCSAIAPRPAWIDGPRPQLQLNRDPRQGEAVEAPTGTAPVEVSVVSPGTPLTEPPELSVVLVVRNDLERLVEGLASWRVAVGERVTQTVVVDAGSTDRTTSTLVTRHREATLLRTGTDLGPAWSVDIGLARCEGPVLILADPGVRPTAADVDRLLDHLEAHERCGVVAAALARADGSPREGSAPRPTLRHLAVEESALARLWPDNPWRRQLHTCEQDAAAAPACENPPAGLLAVRREALDEVGPLDTNLPVHAHFLDWYRRLADASWEVHLAADLAVPLVDGPPPPDDDAWRRHRDRIRYARKHHGKWGVRCCTASLWSFALLEFAARMVGRSEPENRGLFGAFEALGEARRVRASA